MAENLQSVVDKLKNIKQNYFIHNKEEFKKKSQNALDLLMKMPKECTLKKAEQVQQISMDGIKKFTNCQGYTDAFNVLKDLLSEAESKGFYIATDLATIAEEINNCTTKKPWQVMPCLLGLMDTVPQEIQDVIQLAVEFIPYAEEGLKTIVVDVLSCFGQASRHTDDKIALLFNELEKHCDTVNQSH